MLKSELINRIKILQNTMEQHSIDAYIITETEDIWYLTNITYQPEERPFFLIVLIDEGPKLIVPKLEQSHVTKGIVDCEIITYWDYPSPRGENWDEVFNEMMKKFTKVGIENNVKANILRKINVNELVETELITEQRKIKSEYEIEQIRHSARISDQGMNWILKSVYKGASVIEPFSLSRKIQTKLIQSKKFDPLTTSLLTAVWPAPVSSMPHSVPAFNDLLDDGPNVAMAYFRINGYASECERTFFLNNPSAKERELFHHMTTAREKAFENLRAGVKAADVDVAANVYLEKNNLRKYLLHRTGHGVGLGNHEAPFLAVGSDEILRENMVVTIEPGIYIDGTGGYRHSDTVLITKDGYELLTKAPLKLNDLILKGKTSAKLKGKIMRKMLKLN